MFIGRRPILMLYERYKMSELADDDAHNLVIFLFYQVTNFSIFSRRFHVCSMINKANYLQLLFYRENKRKWPIRAHHLAKLVRFFVVEYQAVFCASTEKVCRLKHLPFLCHTTYFIERLRSADEIARFCRSSVMGFKLKYTNQTAINEKEEDDKQFCVVF